MLAGVRVEETEGEGALQVLTPEERASRAAWVGAVTDDEIRRRTLEEFGRRVKRGGDYRSVFPCLHLKCHFNRRTSGVGCASPAWGAARYRFEVAIPGPDGIFFGAVFPATQKPSTMLSTGRGGGPCSLW